ncbi:MAG: hypothetical protein JWN80_1606 [Microbacteriaceae bacterium]|nr:hypothetical protein [Microbacteriaceae bacterium]
MYHAIVRQRVRALWAKVGVGEYSVAVATAAPDIRFRFLGDTPISADVSGRGAFEAWFVRLYEIFPGLTMRLTDVVAAGPPWNTRVVVRLAISATLRDGSPYRNVASQWATLRWGRMTNDEVLEDTTALAAACAIQLA